MVAPKYPKQAISVLKSILSEECRNQLDYIKKRREILTFMPFDTTTDSPENAHPCNWDILANPPGTTPQHLNLDDVRELTNASMFAVREGMGHTVHCTIRWDYSAAFTLRDWVEVQGRLLNAASKWLRRNGLPVSYLWVRELGRINGPHTHLALHLPAERWGDFKEFMLDSGNFDRGRDASGEAITLTGGTFGTKTAKMRAGVLRYLLKSIDPSAVARAPTQDGGTDLLASQLGIRTDPDRLAVVGKRCGASHSIGATMRRDFGWQELRAVAELRAVLHP